MKEFNLRRLGVAHDAGSVKPTLQDCIEAVLAQNDTLLEGVFAGLQSALLANHAKSFQALQNPAGHAAIERVLVQREAIKTAFSALLRAAMYSGEGSQSSGKPLVRFDDFQFLEEEQIDANIELAMAQQEVLLAVDPVLPTVHALVSGLLGWTTVQAHLNPLKPESYVLALRDSFQQQLQDDPLRSVLMGAAAGLLGTGLQHLYREVIGWLRSQGIEPAGAVGAALGAQVRTADNSVNRTLLTLDKLRKLLSGELDIDGSVGMRDFTHTVPASFEALEDLKLLEPMMRRLAERAEQNKAARRAGLAPDAARQSAQLSQSKRLGQQLGEEVVRLMHENLMQDQRLLGSVRQSLKAMEPILIRLSQVDARFFTDRQHPARQFMEKITSRSLAFSSEQDAGFARFLKTFDNAVQVLSGGTGDAAAFARLLAKLEQSWERDDQEQRQRTEEAARGLLHAEQRNLLAQRVSQEMAERLQNKNVPELVVGFLRGPWAQVVAQSRLSGLEETGAPDSYMGVVDDLLWSVQLRLARRNRSRLMQMVPGLLLKLRQGLALISYPPERVAAFFDALITIHEQAFEIQRAAPEPSAGVAPPKPLDPRPPEPSEDDFWMAENEAQDSGYMAYDSDSAPDFAEETVLPDSVVPQDWTADNLATGSWVDLSLGQEQVRVQLTWASPHRALFMFMSGVGLAHSMSRRTLERFREQGLVRLVSDGRVIDNALDGVAKAALRNALDRAGGGD
ncbi:MAG: DUF1631 domain-containing protein [Rhodoferax sp.]|nr:DUF1631 domain-containing protein [Rhodoferax sp.]MCF8209948.1 DUF1631 domain-containing protein [Rhodoferax sp.]